ncbi:MAG: SMI1/KNR4 family protein [Planctomycetaceae bacterium]
MTSLLSRLMAKWKSHGIECPAGISPADIAAFEQRHFVVLPADMREYFLTVNGMGERGACDNDLFSFWPLQSLISIAEDLPDRCSKFAESSIYFMFADHSVALPTYAIRLSSNPDNANPIVSVFADFGAFEVEVVFGSFTDFVSHYLDNPIDTSAAYSTPSHRFHRDAL